MIGFRNLALTALVAGLAAWTTPSRAAPIEVEFSGQISDIFLVDLGGFLPDPTLAEYTRIAGSFTYDSDTPDGNPDPPENDIGLFVGPLTLALELQKTNPLDAPIPLSGNSDTGFLLTFNDVSLSLPTAPVGGLAPSIDIVSPPEDLVSASACGLLGGTCNGSVNGFDLTGMELFLNAIQDLDILLTSDMPPGAGPVQYETGFLTVQTSDPDAPSRVVEFTSGATAGDPILPVLVTDFFTFIGDVEGDLGTENPIFFDPIVSIGYDFEITGGLLATSILIEEPYGDGVFDLFVYDGVLMDFVDSGFDIFEDVTFDILAMLGGGGLDRFSIRGIEPVAMVDPTDPMGFVTGLTFNTTGAYVMTMEAVTTNTDVPEPATALIVLAGLTPLVVAGRRRRRRDR